MKTKIEVEVALLRAAVEVIAAAVHPSVPFGQVNGVLVALSAHLQTAATATDADNG